jgi:hypothetical protein
MIRTDASDRGGPPSDGPVYREPMSIVTRIILAAAAAVTLLAPYELLIKPGISVFQLGMIPCWAIAGGAIFVGLVFLAAAVLGFSKTVRFDPLGRRMTMQADGLFRLCWSSSHPFDRLGEPAVRADSSSDGPTVYRLEIPIDGWKRRFQVAVFDSAETAEAEASRLRTLLGR